MRGLPGCADAVVDAVAKARGIDLWDELGGRPETWQEAAALYRRLGVRNIAEAVSTVLGEPVAAIQARRGDIVLVRGSLGICRGDVVECWGATVPMREADRAWRL